MKLAIVVGHNSASQGAVRQDTGESEFVWNGRLARRIEHQLAVGVRRDSGAVIDVSFVRLEIFI